MLGARRRIKHAGRGFSLIELLVAVSLLGVVLAPLAALIVQVARRSNEMSGLSHRSAAMIQHANRLSVLPFDSLRSRSGCADVTTPPFPHTWCVRVDSLSATVRRLTLVVTPATARLRPDTLVFARTKPPVNPFNSP